MHDVPDVVLVDDDDLYREALAADLADRGFAVSCFADAPSFLEAMNKGFAAEVALLDWVLPEMSGFELLGALRERGIGLPVVFLTGYSFVERDLRALGHGADDVVDQPRGAEVQARRRRVVIEAQRVLVPAASSARAADYSNLAPIGLHRSTKRAPASGASSPGS